MLYNEVTQTWVEINDGARRTYNTNSQIKCRMKC